MIHSPIVSSGGEVAIQNIWPLCLGGDVDFVCTVTVAVVAHGTKSARNFGGCLTDNCITNIIQLMLSLSMYIGVDMLESIRFGNICIKSVMVI
jgi:hypothetical protein